MSRLIDKLYGNSDAEQTIVSVFNPIQKSEVNNFEIALETLNSNFNKGIITDEIYEKACSELDGLLEKAFQHKYIKREGTKGHYKYFYKEPKGKFKNEEEHNLKVGEIYEHSGGKAKIEDIYTDEESGRKMVDYKHISSAGVHSHETQTLRGFLNNKGNKIDENKKVVEGKPEEGKEEDFVSRILKEVDKKENSQGKLTLINDTLLNSNLSKEDEEKLKKKREEIISERRKQEQKKEIWRFLYTKEKSYKNAVSKTGSPKSGKTSFIITEGKDYTDAYLKAKNEAKFNDNQLLGSNKHENK
jgi:hypothetical protein